MCLFWNFFGAVFLVVTVVRKASTKTSNATKIEVKLNKKNINYIESKDSKVAQRSFNPRPTVKKSMNTLSVIFCGSLCIF